jgi:hypothetical protein
MSKPLDICWTCKHCWITVQKNANYDKAFETQYLKCRKNDVLIQIEIWGRNTNTDVIVKCNDYKKEKLNKK